MSPSFLATLLLFVSSTYSASNTKIHPSVCTFKDTKWNVSFNYYGLALGSGRQLDYYTVDDNVQESGEAEYTYYFNLCAPVLNYPVNSVKCLYGPDPNPSSNTTLLKSYCSEVNTTATPNQCKQSPVDRPTIGGLSYVYQVNQDKSQCYPLSSDDANTDTNTHPSFTYSLFDLSDPTQGMIIQYMNGAWADTCGANRELKINLKCENNVGVPRQTDVIEIATCKYEMSLYTIHGCPAGCPAYANSLCASQGLCGYDFATSRARCFCYWGFTGSSCEQVIEWEIEMEHIGMGNAPTNRKTDNNVGQYVKHFPVSIDMTDPLKGSVVTQSFNVTYDLLQYHQDEVVHVVNDTANMDRDTKNDYRYYFNVGGIVDSDLLPAACQSVDMPCLKPYQNCSSEYWANITRFQNPKTALKSGGAYAFRFLNNSGKEAADECIMLGVHMVDMKLEDEIDNPAHGITMTYANGSFSFDDSGVDSVVNCAFTLNLICPDTRNKYPLPKTGFVIDSSEVTPVGPCHDEANFETALACPFNCITSSHNEISVCSGNGMCVADPSVKFVRCICDEKYYGDDCDKEVQTVISGGGNNGSSNTGFNVAIAIISILLVGFVVAVVYLWRRNKTLEKYAVPLVEDPEQIEPTVPDYSDSDSDHFNNRPKRGGNEMVTMSAAFDDNGSKSKGKGLKAKLFGNKGKKQKQKKYRTQNSNKYQMQNLDISDDDDDDDYSDEQTNGPSAYLAANQNEDSDTD